MSNEEFSQSKLLRVAIVFILILICSRNTLIASNDTQLSTDEILLLMTPEELIGQVFILEFYKTPDAKGWGSPPNLKDLIKDYKVGGVILIAGNENFYNNGNDSTPNQVVSLTNELQNIANISNVPKGSKNLFLPLIIAVDHEGDGWPYTRLRDGLTQLPSNMAINATWNEEYSESVGKIVGTEMKSLGINMLLGPVVDVLDRPRPTGKGDMGVRIMGSNPEWIGRLGRAYVRGVHLGSMDEGKRPRVATVIKHFPGHGGSNRLPDYDIGVIYKNIDELRQMELVPFAHIVKIIENDLMGVSDAILTSHIIYGVGQQTKPVSLDPIGMKALLDLKEFSSWHTSGGIIVSDSLGVKALRKQKNFSYQKTAYDALMAGNDLLVIADWNMYSRMKRSLIYFRSEYDKNPDFRKRIKSAARKVIELKKKLYYNFEVENVLVNPIAITQKLNKNKDTNNELIRRIAQDALTLIHPKSINMLPSQPSKTDRIVVITNVKMARDCYDKNNKSCESFEVLSKNAIEEKIVKLYGPEATDQINPDFISSWTFNDLYKLLHTDAIEGDIAVLQNELNITQLIIFALVDWLPRRKKTDEAINEFLDQLSNNSSKAKIIAIAYGSPYYLDSTYIRKLDAYFAIYSKIDSFVEISVRAIFRDLQPKGYSPVNIGGYNVSKYVDQLKNNNKNLNQETSSPERTTDTKPLTVKDIDNKKESDEKFKFWTKVMDNITQIVLAIVGIIGTIVVAIIQKKKSTNGPKTSG
ncbi:MAG: glycoside hydrolase family 3 protein [Desulfobacteraceae bacterium]|nr:glycoside hydrolase family 3 protein [Desulfobacteraceae bacterium]